MEASAVGAPLVHQGAPRHIPSVVHFAENIFGWHANIAKENLVEFGFPGHLTQRSYRAAGRLHLDERARKALVFREAGIGASDQLTPVADPAVAGPDFLAVDDVVIAVKPRFHLQTGEVGTRVRLGEALAPDFFCAQNFWNVAFFLRFCSIGDDRGADET